MHLESAVCQVARLGAASHGPTVIELAQGECIRTEHSYKYDVNQFRGLAAEAGWVWRHTWLDAERLFSVHAFDVLT
jgi:L-histidine N-alpha-methyltransferase